VSRCFTLEAGFLYWLVLCFAVILGCFAIFRGIIYEFSGLLLFGVPYSNGGCAGVEAARPSCHSAVH
jgi:hypothetical protein